ncbi:DMT family transporter [Arthrobacter sp. NPDC090010]|uniref:DMT family transporter n=1 Tax=Arthrobacter sp. NPDC090010 TaxID=3363942 RepID=UPI0038121CD1
MSKHRFSAASRHFTSQHSSGTVGLPAMVTAGILWGTGGPLGHLLALHGHLSALGVAGCRLLLGGMLVLLLLCVTRSPFPSGRTIWTRIFLIALLTALFQASYFLAVIVTNVSIATLITIGFAPVAVVAVELLQRRRSLTKQLAATMLTAGIGLVLLLGAPGERITVLTIILGGAAALASAVFFAITTLVIANSPDRIEPAVQTGYSFTVGGLLLVPFSVLAGDSGSFTVNATSVASALGLAVVPTVLAYWLYFHALRTVSATQAALLTLIEPLAAALIGCLFLGERLTTSGLLGAGFIAGAMIGAVRGIGPKGVSEDPERR